MMDESIIPNLKSSKIDSQGRMIPPPCVSYELEYVLDHDHYYGIFLQCSQYTVQCSETIMYLDNHYFLFRWLLYEVIAYSYCRHSTQSSC